MIKVNGKIPLKLGNTYISLDLKEVFPLILSKSLDFSLFTSINRNFYAYIRFLSLKINNRRKFSAYEFLYLSFGDFLCELPHFFVSYLICLSTFCILKENILGTWGGLHVPLPGPREPSPWSNNAIKKLSTGPPRNAVKMVPIPIGPSAKNAIKRKTA